jgi:RimJ/RimL family protein N-acetyltransferase
MPGDKTLLQPARPADVRRIRATLAEAIDSSPYYGERFKTQEKRRFDEGFLRTLIAVDPWHLALAYKGEAVAGLIVTIPEFGNLWSPWIYIAPAFRAQALGLTMIRAMLRHWDHGRFHKISCYVRPENRAARTVFSRFGFAETTCLQNHIFGEDFLLLERPLTKVTEGYDDGVRVSRAERLRIRWAARRWP